MKTYNTMQNIGRAKYVINFHNGVKQHEDGSRFFDIHIFKNKKLFTKAINKLKKEGYIYET